MPRVPDRGWAARPRDPAWRTALGWFCVVALLLQFLSPLIEHLANQIGAPAPAFGVDAAVLAGLLALLLR